jgi:hypothetical protein
MPVTAQRDLVALALAPSKTEREKAERTHNMIRNHLESDVELDKYGISTYLQGSYKNSTNVRGDSDVDMGSATSDIFFYDLSDLPDAPPGSSHYGIGKSLREQVQESIRPASYSYWDYRHDVFASLKTEYGTVEDGNKAITVAGNTSRLDADVLPCIAFRMYYKTYMERADYHEGIAFLTAERKRIINFPKQHFENLGEKDQRKDGKVKGCVRIIKRLRNETEEAGRWDRKRSPSFYLESLVWNAPDSKFSGGYPAVLQNVLAYLWNDLREKKAKNDLTSYTQANKIFYLFHPEFWNVDDALAFIDQIWQAAFKDE